MATADRVILDSDVLIDDLYETPTRKRKHLLDLSPAEAMTLAEEGIRDNWEAYRAEFLRRNAR